MDYSIKIDAFEGPLDLLLHLIKKKKMNILDIKLEIIIDEYLEYKENEVIHSSLEVDALKKAYEELLKRIEDEKPVQTKVTKKEISVDDQINKIREKFKQEKQINFFDLFEFKDKSYLVVTFLAILEMAKNKEIVIKQNSNFANIVCEVVE